MVGDNSVLYVVFNFVELGDVLVVDVGGFLGNVVWGGLMIEVVWWKGIVGFVIDGVICDCFEIVVFFFFCFVCGFVLVGLYKIFGGEIDGFVVCGGVVVSFGDLVIVDVDGVMIVLLLWVVEI